MDESARVIDWDAVEATELFPGVIRQAVTTTTSTVVRYTYHPGCVFPIHQHPEEQVTVVHTGVIEFEVGGEPVSLRAGQLAVIPGGVPHGARVTGSVTVITDNYIASANRTPLQFDGSGS
ncbi:MAG TPA: cupin domain-containing protein [Thermomicrobiales bacterium]|nr:cupin domain-containing protein [Thermomicrobiales bacterium]